ncbi:MAG: M56 family metallopeptidase, partial [Actinomycetota bacterium]|nr:M56 family metallopeptidase [Actinomycetota bacterium]
MASARRLYRAGVALGAVGVAAVALGLAVAVTAFSLSVPSVGELAAACRRFLPAETGLPALLPITVGGLGLVVLARAARALARQLAAQRRAARGLRIHGRAELGGVEFLLIESASAQAFCAGFLRPRIYVSSAALERLSDAELAAVLAHERHHLRRRDPLRMLFANVLADALFFLPALHRLADRY